jgi:hypothetical protein
MAIILLALVLLAGSVVLAMTGGVPSGRRQRR